MSKSYTDVKSLFSYNSQPFQKQSLKINGSQKSVLDYDYNYYNNDVINSDSLLTQDTDFTGFKLRQQNADLRKQNSILMDQNRFRSDKFAIENSQQQLMVHELEKENFQQKNIIFELEQKYAEQVKLAECHEQEVYRMRMQYDEAKTQLESIIKEKDAELMELKNRLSGLLSEKPNNLDLRQRLDDEYNRSVRQSLMDYERQQKGKKDKHKNKEEQIDNQLNEYLNQFQSPEKQQQMQRQQEEDEQKQMLREEQREKDFSRILQYEHEKKQLLNQVKEQAEQIFKLEQEVLQFKTQQQFLEEQNQSLETKMRMQKEESDKKIKDLLKSQNEKIKSEARMQNVTQQVETAKVKAQNEEQTKEIRKISVQKQKDDQETRNLQAEIKSLKLKIKQFEAKEQVKMEKKEEERKVQEPTIVKVSEDRNLLNANIGILHYARESIVDVIFEIYVRSNNQAFTRKSNSLTIFQINLKELKEKNVRGLVIVLYLYKKMKQLAKSYFPNYGKATVMDDVHVRQKLAKFKKMGENEEIRSNVNQWLEQSIVTIKYRRSHKEKDDPNRDLMYLFRLLSLSYRCKYPLRGLPYDIDMDLKLRLENKICGALLMNFINEDEDWN